MNTLWRAVAVAAAVTTLTAAGPGSAVPSNPDDKVIVHVLDRIGFGARPGDIDRIRRAGLATYIEQQLQPDRITDDGMAERLQPFQTLTKSSRELTETYFIPAQRARQQAKRQAAADPSMSEPPMRTPEQMELARQERAVVLDLAGQKILRAVYSERQLQEVMTDFWFNHFNVYANKGATQQYLIEYERDTIRPRALGRFRDLLGATAKSPAMLFYLDNWQSADPDAPLPRRAALMQPQRPRRGLNENYGRELLELHTLGVDGGYTQDDVIEVARAFTGWTIDQPRQGGTFHFDARLHDNRKKHVLGHDIRAGGQADGEAVLDLLARHPATARFIATKLATRFVSDAPPQSLIDRAAATFRDTDGDIREVMRTILTSPEFFAPSAYRAKVKTPFEFVVSAIRTTNSQVTATEPLVQALRQLGMPLYLCQPPTGYPDRADAWINTGALVNRMNFALQLANGRLRGVQWAGTTTALALGSPEFQRR